VARAQLPDRPAPLAFDTLGLWCAALAVEVSSASTWPGRARSTPRSRRGARIGAYMAERSAEFANLITLGPTPASTPAEERFEFGLDVSSRVWRRSGGNSCTVGATPSVEGSKREVRACAERGKHCGSSVR
jgi:hypothetical protein